MELVIGILIPQPGTNWRALFDTLMAAANRAYPNINPVGGAGAPRAGGPAGAGRAGNNPGGAARGVFQGAARGVFQGAGRARGVDPGAGRGDGGLALGRARGRASLPVEQVLQVARGRAILRRPSSKSLQGKTRLMRGVISPQDSV